MRFVALLVVTMILLTSAACGDDDGDDTADDPRRGQIGGVAELAVDAYASAGVETLADYMTADALARCPTNQLADAVAGQPVPTGFRQLKDVDFDGDTAVATITIATREGEDAELVWTFVEEEEDSWRIDDMPGMEKCGS